MPEDFGSREHHIVRIFQIGAAMVLLCAMSLATSVAAALRESAKTEAELHGLAEAVEVMKEILAQVSVNPGYKDHTAAASFCHCCLYTLRAILLDWSISTTAVQTMPLAKMPKIEGNALLHVEHPNCRIFLAEVQSSMRFLTLHSKAFEGEPWVWFVDFLETLEYHLAV